MSIGFYHLCIIRTGVSGVVRLDCSGTTRLLAGRPHVADTRAGRADGSAGWLLSRYGGVRTAEGARLDVVSIAPDELMFLLYNCIVHCWHKSACKHALHNILI